MGRSRGSLWLYGAIGLLGIFIVASVVGRIVGGISRDDPDPDGSAVPATPQAPANSIPISIASSNTKQTWLHQAVDAFNASAPSDSKLQVDGKPVFVQILQEDIDGNPVDYRSGTMVSDTLAGRIQPTILSPGEESWIAKFEREWDAQEGGDPITGTTPILVRTPLVVAMWQSRARALGCWPTAEPGCTWAELRTLANDPQGWASKGHPQWRKFKFGYGYFGESNSGTLAVLSMCMAGLGKTTGLAIGEVGSSSPCGVFVSDVEKAKVHSGKSDVWLIDKMVTGGPEYLDAVVTYESNVIATNKASGANLREPLVSVYPQDGTIVVGHPFAILDGTPWVTPEQVSAAGLFRDYLLTAKEQEAVLALGLRPADPNVPLGTPIDAALGANPTANLVALGVPDTLVIDRVGEVWHEVRKHAIIAVVFDKSGSMEGSKITAAVKGAEEFVNRMDRADTLLWVPFDEQIYPGARGTKADVGEQLVEEIRSTTADGGTALYDAVTYAFTELTAIRNVEGDAHRYGIVVLSDGQDRNSTNTLSLLESALAPSEGDPTGIQIHTISIGEDADDAVLKKIASAAHGRFWKPKSESEIVVVYRDIAAHY
jgi:Ca-activated chloride channel family protein